jgi:hypothetical protein
MTLRHELVEGAGGSDADHEGPGASADVAYCRRSLLSGVRHQDRSGKVLLVNSGDDSTGVQNGTEIVNPWEERKDQGRVSAFVASLVLLATSPRKFYEGTRTDAGWWGPLVFAGLVLTLGFFLNGLVLIVLALTLPDAVLELVHRMELFSEPADVSGLEGSPFLQQILPFLGLQVLLLILPVVFVLSLLGPLLSAAFLHLLLIVTRSPRPAGFRGTWIAACYAAGAFLFNAIPVAGDILAIVGSAGLFAVGLHVLQGLKASRAALLAAILPLLLFVGALLEILLVAPAM